MLDNPGRQQDFTVMTSASMEGCFTCLHVYMSTCLHVYVSACLHVYMFTNMPCLECGTNGGEGAPSKAQYSFNFFFYVFASVKLVPVHRVTSHS
jgi:hypothetical protein